MPSGPVRLHAARYALLVLMCAGLWIASGRVDLIAMADECLRFVSGDPPPRVGTPWHPFVFGAVILQVALAVPLAETLRVLIGAPPSDKKPRLAMPRFRSSALTVAVTAVCCLVAAAFVSAFAGVTEEILFRWAPLVWWDPSDPDERAAFYVFLFLSTALFALAHVRRGEEPYRLRALRTLPQFLMGFWDALVFMKFGLVAAIAGHFLYDLVVIFARCPFIIAEALGSTPD